MLIFDGRGIVPQYIMSANWVHSFEYQRLSSIETGV